MIVVEPLLRFLDERGLGEGEPVITRLGDGHSNLTYAIERAGCRMVLRRPPRPPFPPSAHNMLREARLLSALAPTPIPVAEVLAACEDASVIGVPFYVTEYLDGQVFTLQTPASLDSAVSRASIADQLVDTLVEIHAVDWQGDAVLRTVGRPHGYLDRQVSRFAELLDGYRTREIPALDRLTGRLRRHRPESGPASIVHGDFRLGNLMFANGSEANLIAVFDWEMATLGDPLADVGYLAAMWAAPGYPRGLLKLSRATTEPGYPSRQEVVQRYADRSGRSTKDISWYTVLAIWKFCVIMEGNYRRAIEGGSDDAFSATFGADVVELAAYAEQLVTGDPT